MFQVLFVLFIIIPIIEIAVLLQVGELLGLWPTIAIVIASAWLGAKYVRQQGLATMQSVQAKMAQGEMPSSEIVTALMLLVAGVLLVTPGFVTDIFGLSLLIPSVRQAIAAMVQKRIVVNQMGAGAAFHQGNTYQGEPSNVNQPNEDEGFYPHERKPVSHHEGKTLEGDFERKD
jgi:UPF0716 protein FxsA